MKKNILLIDSVINNERLNNQNWKDEVKIIIYNVLGYYPRTLSYPITPCFGQDLSSEENEYKSSMQTSLNDIFWADIVIVPLELKNQHDVRIRTSIAEDVGIVVVYYDGNADHLSDAIN